MSENKIKEEIKKGKKIFKENKKENPEQKKVTNEEGYPPNHYKNYLIEYTPYDPPAGVEPMH
jgi:hypothetical protein